jgi:short-subunit dehydrogenase
VDVADRDAAYRFAADAVAAHGTVDANVNNAGVALAGAVEELSDEGLDWIFWINFWGVVHGTRAFLPHLRTRPRAHVVNISSIFGLVATPRMAAYNATRFAVRGFTEALRQDLAGSSVIATCVHPGGIATNIARSARVEGAKAARRGEFTTADQAAARIIRGMERGERRVLVGRDAHLADLVARLLPTSYPWLVGRLVQGLDWCVARRPPCRDCGPSPRRRFTYTSREPSSRSSSRAGPRRRVSRCPGPSRTCCGSRGWRTFWSSTTGPADSRAPGTGWRVWHGHSANAWPRTEPGTPT